MNDYFSHISNKNKVLLYAFDVVLCFTLNGDVLYSRLEPSGRASDSGARGPGFDPHSGRRVVSLSKIHLPPKKNW